MNSKSRPFVILRRYAGTRVSTLLLLLGVCVLMLSLAGCRRSLKLGDPDGSRTGRINDVQDRSFQPLTGPKDNLTWRAESPKEPIAVRLADAVGQNRLAINIAWTLLTGALVMFMQAGFAMVECGLCRRKNAAHVLMMNFMIYPISMLGFWLVGFALMFGGMGVAPEGGGPASLGGLPPLSGQDVGGFFGFFGFGLWGCYDVGVYTFFLFQTVFLNTMATIPTGALAERWRFKAFVAYGLFVSILLYPIYGHWVWGNGALAHLAKLGLGNGAVDFAGSGVVHAVGGCAALAGALTLGPRTGKYDADGRAVALPAHNLALSILGTFILAFGWFGFNAGSTLGASGGNALRIGIIAVNTMLASGSGAITAMLYRGRPDPMMCANGMLAGLVSITASCAYVESWHAVLIGLIAGGLVCAASDFFEHQFKLDWHWLKCRLGVPKERMHLPLRVDDPVGAIAVHGVCGLWGVLSVGIFADGTYGGSLNGVSHGVVGILYGLDGLGQLAAQLISCVVCVGWSLGTSLVFFALQNAWMRNGIRSSAIEEELGLDLSEIGMPIDELAGLTPADGPVPAAAA